MSQLKALTLPNNVTITDLFADGEKHYVTVAGMDGDDAIISTKTGIIRVAAAELPIRYLYARHMRSGSVAGLKLYVNDQLVVVGNSLDEATRCDDQLRAPSSGCIESGSPLSMV